MRAFDVDRRAAFVNVQRNSTQPHNTQRMMLTAFRYRLPLAAPLPLPGVTLTCREGLLLRLEDDDGRCGWGDVAPLPGFSRETLMEAARAVEQLRRRVDDLPVGEDVLDPDGALAARLDAWALPPSVRFGVELAVANLGAAVRRTTLPHVFTAAPSDDVVVNALLTGGDEHLPREVRRLRRAGYRTVKLKVGRRPVADAVCRVRTVARALEPGMALRLDANRAWTQDEATAFAHGVRDVDVEYVEEPLARPEDLPHFAAQHPHLPVALDETTRERRPCELTELDHVRAVVLKPTLLGGIVPTVRWARAAHERDVKVVLSTSFESGVGLLGLAALAATLGDGITAHGLDAYDRLQDDVLMPRPAWQGGRIDVQALFAGMTVPTPDRLDRLF